MKKIIVGAAIGVALAATLVGGSLAQSTSGNFVRSVVGAFADGWDTTQGAKADSACSTATGTCSVVALLKYFNSNMVTGGTLTNYFVQPTAGDNHAVIKNGAGTVYGIQATNNSATLNYLRLYNAGTGFNGCNSATNIVGQWAIPASTSGAGIVVPLSNLGLSFATGISICVTSGYATTDTTNATASAMSVNVQYK